MENWAQGQLVEGNVEMCGAQNEQKHRGKGQNSEGSHLLAGAGIWGQQDAM